MKKQKVYLETTMFNFFFDTARGDMHVATREFFDKIKKGEFDAFTSAYVVDELVNAQEPKRTDMLNLIKTYNIAIINKDDEFLRLADLYIKNGLVPKSYRFDAIHIAVAYVRELDYILSFNFHHINRIKTKEGVAHISKQEGYNKPVIICAPMEVIYE